MGRYISVNNIPVATTVEASSAYTAQINDRILADTTSGVFTITLPLSPLDGDTIQVIDIASQFATNVLTVGRNGSNINGAAEDLDLDITGSIVSFVYTNATIGWFIASA